MDTEVFNLALQASQNQILLAAKYLEGRSLTEKVCLFFFVYLSLRQYAYIIKVAHYQKHLACASKLSFSNHWQKLVFSI